MGVDYSAPFGSSFCLDGQRVIPRPDNLLCPKLSGAGSVGEYFTELDPSARICGYAGGSGEIAFWVVFPKDGTMRRYGYAGNSSLRPNDGNGNALTVGYAVQALDRIADAIANTVDFVYSADVATGELLLSEARYTGKVADRLDMAAG